MMVRLKQRLEGESEDTTMSEGEDEALNVGEIARTVMSIYLRAT